MELCSPYVLKRSGHGPVGFRRGNRARVIEPVSRNGRGVGPGSWGALGAQDHPRGGPIGRHLRRSFARPCERLDQGCRKAGIAGKSGWRSGPESRRCSNPTRPVAT